MAKRDLKDVLRQLAEELETEDRSETLEARLVALEEREAAGATITTAQIIAALEGATDEELEALHGTVVDRLAREVEDRRDGAGGGETDEARQARETAEAVAAAEARRLRLEAEGTTETRPGRKQGQAYNWETDDDGQVVPLNVARIWNEPDEEDEVALPPAPVTEEVTA